MTIEVTVGSATEMQLRVSPMDKITAFMECCPAISAGEYIQVSSSEVLRYNLVAVPAPLVASAIGCNRQRSTRQLQQVHAVSERRNWRQSQHILQAVRPMQGMRSPALQARHTRARAAGSGAICLFTVLFFIEKEKLSLTNFIPLGTGSYLHCACLLPY